MWVKLLKYELSLQFKNPLCIVYLVIPILSFLISSVTYQERIEMYEMIWKSYSAGLLSMFVRDNFALWFVISIVLTANENHHYYKYHFNRTFPVSKNNRWFAKTLSMWILSSIHWSLFFVLLQVFINVFLNYDIPLGMLFFVIIISSGGVIVMGVTTLQYINNTILYTIIFVILYVFSSAIDSFQDYNIFTYAAAIPYIFTDFKIDETRRFIFIILPLYYSLAWTLGLFKFDKRK